MRRRTVRILAILFVSFAVLAALLFFHGFRSRPAHLSDLMVDEAQFTRLAESRAEDPALVSAFLCNGFEAPAAGCDFYYSIIEGDPTGMDPVVEARGDCSLKLAFLRRALDGQTLRSGGGLPFIAYSDNAYCAGTLYPTTLPVMRITVTEPDQNGSYDITDRVYRDAEMLLFDNRAAIPATSRYSRSDLTLRVRGNTTAVLPKQSYRLSLFQVSTGNHRRHNDLPLLGMRADEDWILYSAGSDCERIRNTLSNNLWYSTGAAENARGVTLGVECRYVELLMNGQYMGLYSLMYPLDKKQISLPDDGFYYRGASYQQTTIEMLNQATDAPAVGGWELRYPSRAAAKGRACWTGLASYYEYIYTVQDMNYCVWFDKSLDTQNIVNLHLFLSLIDGRDNYYKNNNVIAYPQDDGSWRYLLAPWDLDLTFGHEFSPDTRWRISEELSAPDRAYNPWPLPANRMISLSPEFRHTVLDRWHELRASEWSDEALSALLDEYEQQIFGSGAMARERERWPDAPSSEDLSQLRAWLRARLAYLDGYFEEVMGR